MHIAAADLPGRLREMARNGLIETVLGGRRLPPDDAASVVEFAADIIELRDRRIAILSDLLRTASSILVELAEVTIADHPVVGPRVRQASDAIKSAVARLDQTTQD